MTFTYTQTKIKIFMVLYTEFRTVWFPHFVLQGPDLSIQTNFDIHAWFEASLKLILNCTGLLPSH